MLIVLAGCSSGDDTTSAEIDSETPAVDDTVDQGGDEQADEGDSGGTLDLAQTTIPFPDGVTFELSRTESGLTLYYPPEDGDRIISFYDDWTSSEPDSYERAEPSEDGTLWTFVSESGEDLRIISVEQNFDGGQNFGTITFVTLLF